MKRPAPPLSGLAAVASAAPDAVELDAVDRQLLALLSKDARSSQRRLGRELRMSPPAIGERIARLERTGVISRYTVSLNWTALGYTTCYLAVSAMQGAEQGPIMAALGGLPEVEEVNVITGSLDMLARVRVRDHAHLRRLLLEQVWQLDGVQRTETFMSLAELPPKDLVASMLAVDEPDAASRRSTAER